MPTYPNLPIDKDTDPIVRDGRDESRADNGDTYVRRFYTADKYDFEIRHPNLTDAQWATLQAFYAANPSGTFDLLWPGDGVTYTGLKFGKGGLRWKWAGPGRRHVNVRLVT